MALTMKNKKAEPYSESEILKNEYLDRDRLLASIDVGIEEGTSEDKIEKIIESAHRSTEDE